MRFFTVITSILLTLSAYGAKTAYDYDEAGNRIKRYLIVEEIPNVTEASFRSGDDKDEASEENTADESAADKALQDDGISVSVYPNPTTGVVNVEIPGLDEEAVNTLFLYDAKGETVLSRKRLRGSNSIDFVNTPNGLYILKLNLGGSEKSYRIIKKQ